MIGITRCLYAVKCISAPIPAWDLVDIVDIDVGLGDEVVLARHDVHDLVATLDHRTDREHREVDDIAAIGRADLGALEHVARRLQPRYDIGELGLSLAQILGNVGIRSFRAWMICSSISPIAWRARAIEPLMSPC
jgi:hypothetical protein